MARIQVAWNFLVDFKGVNYTLVAELRFTIQNSRKPDMYHGIIVDPFFHRLKDRLDSLLPIQFWHIPEHTPLSNRVATVPGKEVFWILKKSEGNGTVKGLPSSSQFYPVVKGHQFERSLEYNETERRFVITGRPRVGVLADVHFPRSAYTRWDTVISIVRVLASGGKDAKKRICHAMSTSRVRAHHLAWGGM